jgi:hypothetical protein
MEMELAGLFGWAILITWEFMPMILIVKSPNTSGGEKFLWAIGTFFPLIIVVLIEKILKYLSPTHAWASETLDSRTGAYIMVMTFLIGGWIVHTIYGYVYQKKFDFEQDIFSDATQDSGRPTLSKHGMGWYRVGNYIGRLFKKT